MLAAHHASANDAVSNVHYHILLRVRAAHVTIIPIMSAIRFNSADHPHRRYNPLTGDWVLVSPHRSKRPWSGQLETPPATLTAAHDPDCYLCPGNTRSSGSVNPDYAGTYIFANDFAALLPDTPTFDNDDPLMRTSTVQGENYVICYSPDHGQTLSQMSTSSISSVIDTWAAEVERLGASYPWVQVFENRGEMMGSSQPHPHGQIWANSFVPAEVAREDEGLRQYAIEHGSNLLLDYAAAELADGRRTVVATAHWLAVVPYWASWPFETLLLPLQPVSGLQSLTDAERDDLAVILKKLTTRYDNLFQCDFPYSMGWHFAPFNLEADDRSHWQLHAHFYPPLLRSASIRKFMVGYEMLAEAQRDLTPEQAAAQLQQASERHYRL